MTTTYSPAEVDQLCKRMQAWEDDAVSRDGACVKCGEPIGGKEPEHEPSPLCNACAQDLATRTFPDQLEAARSEIERLTNANAKLGQPAKGVDAARVRRAVWRAFDDALPNYPPVFELADRLGAELGAVEYPDDLNAEKLRRAIVAVGHGRPKLRDTALAAADIMADQLAGDGGAGPWQGGTMSDRESLMLGVLLGRLDQVDVVLGNAMRLSSKLTKDERAKMQQAWNDICDVTDAVRKRADP